MKFTKVLLFGGLLAGLPVGAFADDLWGTSNSGSSEMGSDNDLWGSAAPKKKAPAAQPAPAPAPKAEAPKPQAPKPQPPKPETLQAQPVQARPEPAPVQQAPAPQNDDPYVYVPAQQDSVVPVIPVSTVEPSVDSSAVVADTTSEFGTGFLTEAADTTNVAPAAAPVAVVDTAKKDSAVTPVAPAPVANVEPAKVDSAKAAPAAAKGDGSGSNFYVGFGVVADGAFGMFSQKLRSDNFLNPEFAGGLSLLFGYAHIALRLDGKFKYEMVYVNEDIGSVNESCMRLGGGAYLRYTSGMKTGLVGEVGVSFFPALSDDIELYRNGNYTWQLNFDTEMPLEFALGYKFPASIFMMEADLIGSYDLNKPVDFAFGSSKKSGAWHAGARLIAWFI